MKQSIKQIFPEAVLKLLGQIYGFLLDGWATKSYSQEGEDMILRRIFGGQSSGFYVDVGAHHPKRFSNTFYFYKKGWRGVNIDAMPGSMRAFRRSRSRDINLEVPISSEGGTLTYYLFNEPALNGFSQEISEFRDGRFGYKIIAKQDIQTLPLEEVLDNNLPEGEKIDFLSVDVEGFDLDVLRSMNIEKYQPRVILVEMLGASLATVKDAEIFRYLNGYGYEVYAKAVNTIIFKSKYF